MTGTPFCFVKRLQRPQKAFFTAEGRRILVKNTDAAFGGKIQKNSIFF